MFDCRIEEGRIVMDKIWEEPRVESRKVAPSESATQPFALHCLGRFVLLHDGVPVVLVRKKARELLAFLACEEGKPVPKATVAEALWPDVSRARALDSLYKIVHYLDGRAQEREIPVIASVCGSLCLDVEQLDCDILLFKRLTGPSASIEELRQAVELYRGPLLLEEAYEWTVRAEGFYDLRYLETVERLRDYFHQMKRWKEADYYTRLLCL